MKISKLFLGSNVDKTRLKKIVSNREEFIKIQIPDDAFNFDDIEQVFKNVIHQSFNVASNLDF